jgi:CheY-like chemotaxis protein
VIAVQESALTGRTILIVDDEPEIRESLRDALSEEGYQVMLARNGAEALALLPGVARPCAIILDLIMPVMSGGDFYAAIQADPRFADIPVLITTSDPSRAPPGLPVVKKPMRLPRLLGAVEALF